jgi:hypothetical protein
MLNMVTPKDVDDQLRDEVVSECSNYGKVIVSLDYLNIHTQGFRNNPNAKCG